MLLFAAAIQVRLNVILYYFPGGYKPNRRLTHGGLLNRIRSYSLTDSLKPRLGIDLIGQQYLPARLCHDARVTSHKL